MKKTNELDKKIENENNEKIKKLKEKNLLLKRCSKKCSMVNNKRQKSLYLERFSHKLKYVKNS